MCWSPLFLYQREPWKWASEASLFYHWERKAQGDEEIRLMEQLTGALAREQGYLTPGPVPEQSRERKMMKTGVYYIFKKHFTDCGILFYFFLWVQKRKTIMNWHWNSFISHYFSIPVKEDTRDEHSTQFSLVSHSFEQYLWRALTLGFSSEPRSPCCYGVYILVER